MKRYSQFVGSTYVMEDDPDGKWVKHSEAMEAVQAEREAKQELKNAYAETFEEYIPADKLGEANDFLLSRFKDHESSVVMVDMKEAIRKRGEE